MNPDIPSDRSWNLELLYLINSAFQGFLFIFGYYFPPISYRVLKLMLYSVYRLWNCLNGIYEIPFWNKNRFFDYRIEISLFPNGLVDYVIKIRFKMFFDEFSMSLLSELLSFPSSILSLVVLTFKHKPNQPLCLPISSRKIKLTIKQSGPCKHESFRSPPFKNCKGKYIHFSIVMFYGVYFIILTK